MTGRFEVRLPDLGEGIAEGEIGEWLVRPGDAVKEDQPLVEVTTDKSTVEIPSPLRGHLAQVVAATGSVVPVGSVLAVLEPDSLEAEQRAPADAAAPGFGAAAPGFEAAAPGAEAAGHVEVAATPGARRLAGQLGVDLARVRDGIGAGPIREEHVQAYADAPRPAGSTTGSEVQDALRQAAAGDAGDLVLADRSVIAARLTRAAAVPTVTNVDEADFGAVRAADVSPLDAVAFVVSRTLLEHPRCNMLAPDGRPLPQQSVHLGIATQTDAGLVVPVVRDAQALSVAELGAAIRDVTSRARAGRLRPSELGGSTFTVTSAGKTAGQWSTPLLNLPEVAILGLYRIADRPAVRDGAVVVRPMGNLSITFDHRYLDGLTAAAFLQAVIARLESWEERA